MISGFYNNTVSYTHLDVYKRQALYSINLNIMQRHANQALSADKYNLVLSSRNLTHAIIVGCLLYTSPACCANAFCRVLCSVAETSSLHRAIHSYLLSDDFAVVITHMLSLCLLYTSYYHLIVIT